MRILGSLLILAALTAAAIAGDTPRPAEELTFTSLTGKQVALEDYKGKVVLVMFFSTDCPHCQQTATVLAPIYDDLKSKGFEVLGLAMNPSAKDNLRAFAEKYNADYPVGLATRAEFAAFSGLSVMERFYYPYLLFVDRQGVVQLEKQGADRQFFADLNGNLREAVNQLLAQKSSS